MNNKSIKKNYLYNVIYQILTIILPLVTTPYVSRVLGSDNIGIYSYTLSIATYFILIGSLGISLYGQREIAYHQENKLKRSTIFWELNIIKWISLIISMILFYMFFCLNGQYTIYYKILLLEIFANMIDISWYFQGLEDFKTTVIRNSIVKMISVGLIFAFVKTKNDLMIYFLIYALSDIIGNLTLWIKLPKVLSKAKIQTSSLKRYFKPIFQMFIPQITIQIYTLLDRTMLGKILNDMHQVGIYEQAQKIDKLSLTIVTSLGTVMIPRIASLYKSDKKEEIVQRIYKSFHFVWLVALPITFGLISISNNLVPWFLGNDFLDAIPILQIGALLVIAIGLNNVTGMQLLVPTNRQNVFTITVIIGALSNVIGNSILIPRYKAIGAIISSVIAESLIFIIQYIYLRKELSLKKIFNFMPRCFISSIVMFVIISLCSRYFNPSIKSTIILIIGGILVYGICIMAFKDDLVIEIITKTKNKIKRKKEYEK